MSTRTAAGQRRAAVRWMTAFVVCLAASFAMWWLVARTNAEGHHDAELLPLFSLIPLAIGLYHLYRSHRLARREQRRGSPAGSPR